VVAEALVRQRIEDWAKAVSAKDLEAVLALYAPDNVSFDLDPPLRYAGAEIKRRAWRGPPSAAETSARGAGPIFSVHEAGACLRGDPGWLSSDQVSVTAPHRAGEYEGQVLRGATKIGPA
jgi:ketosteroid isomerase-like protein